MPLTEEERRRCCILGGCGCGPPEQREAMRTWLLTNLNAIPQGTEQRYTTSYRRLVDGWLDDLFQDTAAGRVIASSARDFILGDEPVEIDLVLEPGTTEDEDDGA